jgi:hypothetical protein
MDNSKAIMKKTICLFMLIAICYVLLIHTTIIRFERSLYTNSESVFKKQGEKKIIIAFRNDDISFNSNVEHEASVLDLFWKYRIKQTFGFIPKHRDIKDSGSNFLRDEYPILGALENWLKQGKIDLALHGYEHKKSKGSSGEFDGLPYKSQVENISSGKSILEKELNNNVNIFVPPWNQADENTVRACLNSKINIFSGYLGEMPAEGMTFVNSNAVLFRHANRLGEGEGVPAVEDLLHYAKNSNGTTFIIAFYHSRTGLRKPKDILNLKRLLNNITNHPLVEISSIREIAEKYQNLLPAYNQAGLNIKQAAGSQHRAKPYILVYKKLYNTIGKDLGIDSLYNDSFRLYWSGNYKHASLLAHKIIQTCDNYIVWGRLIAIFAAGAVYSLFLWIGKYDRVKALFSFYHHFLSILVAVFIAIVALLNISRPISDLRINEINIILGLFVGTILILYGVIKILNVSRSTNSRF